MGWGRRDEGTGRDVNYDVLPVSPGFTKLLGIEIIEGRDFMPSDGETQVGVMLLNETAKKAYDMTLESRTIGHNPNGPSTLAGFMRDFHFKPLQYGIDPMALYVGGPDYWKRLGTAYMRVDGANIGETIEYIRETIKRLAPALEVDEIPIEFLDASVGRLYEKEDRLAALITVSSLLTVFISIVGVFGLVLFEIQCRRREIAIRKVYGASVAEILSMVNRGFVVTIIVCFALAAPLAWWAFRQWQAEFAYRWPVAWWVFVVAPAVVLVVTLATVTLQSLRAARTNPVETLQK
jgi:putative ABC transport system permease protein